jgi:hypothetical protein
VRALVDVLGTLTRTPHTTHFALWSGFADEVSSLRERSRPIPATGDNFLADGSFIEVIDDLSWAVMRSDEDGHRFPVAMWPADGAFVVATAPYHDSLYLSADVATVGALRTRGVDVVVIDRDAGLPSTDGCPPS